MSITHHQGILDKESCSELFSFLRNIEYTSYPLSPNSRPVSYMGPADMIHPSLVNLKTSLELNFGVKISPQCFINLYRDGNDYCPYHSHPNFPDSFLISLGCTRDFLLKKNGEKCQKFSMANGNILFVPKTVHKDHKHSVPKRKNVTGVRISIILYVEK